MPSKCNRNEWRSIPWAALGLSVFLHLFLIAGLYWLWTSIPKVGGLGPGVVTMDLGDFGPGQAGGAPSTPTPANKKNHTAINSNSIKQTASGEGNGQGGGIGEGTGGNGGGTGSGLGGGSGDGFLSQYIRQVLTRIERNKRYPKISQENGEEGIVLVDLRIGRSGQLLGYDFRPGEAHPRLVAATKTSIEAAAPFPPLPEYYAQETLSLQVPVRYQLH